MTITLPYRDTPKTPAAFSLSVLLHGLLVVGLVAMFWFSPPPQRPIMAHTMVSIRSSDLNSEDTPQKGDPGGTIKIPTMSSPTPLPPEPQPDPAPEPVTTPSPPTPIVNSKPPPAPSKPTVQTNPRGTLPGPKPTAATTVPYKDWLKSQAGRTATAATSAPRSTGRPVPTVGVNVTNIVKGLTNGSVGSGQGHNNTVSGPQSEDYWSKIVQRLQDAFVPPPGTSNLNAEIHLTIDGDGRVVFKSLTRRSGNSVFDAAVMDVLQNLTNVDPPPGGGQVSNTFKFSPNGN